MTERLYYGDMKLDSCMSAVQETRQDGGVFEVLIDKTVIFPESGGQLSDTGTLGGARVLHASEEGENVWLRLDKQVRTGDTLEMRLDMAGRLDHSQQHTGEHIISGLACKLFGAKNVGFHMAEDYATLDLDTFLDEKSITELVLAANAAVRRNVPVRIEVTDADTAASLSLRKKAEGLKGDIRIVYIDGVDSCTCCGTHCAFTGEVGYITIVSCVKYKGGTRIWFACGERAVKEALVRQDAIARIARRFSVKEEEAVEAVMRQGDELTGTRKLLRERTAELMRRRAEELLLSAQEVGDTRLSVSVQQGLSMNELKQLSEYLVKDDKTVAVTFSHCGEDIFYQLSRSGRARFSMKELICAVNAAMNGKGGGREDSAQGSAKASPGFMDAVEQLKGYFCAMMKG